MCLQFQVKNKLSYEWIQKCDCLNASYVKRIRQPWIFSQRIIELILTIEHRQLKIIKKNIIETRRYVYHVPTFYLETIYRPENRML